MSKKRTSSYQEIFYDYFRAYTESGEWLIPMVPQETALYKEILQSALRVLMTSQIRVLSPEVARFALDLVNKAGETPVPYVPYPRYPMWVEFGGDISVGDENTQYKAIWAFPSMDRAKTIHFDLITVHGQSKSLFVREDGSEWWYQQGGACESSACHRAKKTVEGEPYEIASEEAPNLMMQDCLCAGAGQQWAQLIFLIGHLLRMPGREIRETVTKRDMPLPRNFHERQRIEAENKRHPRYVTLSLSHPLEIHARTTKRNATPAGEIPVYLETLQVAGSWRTLIPGEGKPWKELQIFYVESYKRSGNASEAATRYIIER